MKWFLIVMKKAFVFKGRARRKEYWMFALIAFLIGIATNVIDLLNGWMLTPAIGVLSALFSLLIFLPNISVSVRRMHDLGYSGWWVMIILLPILGPLLLLMMFCYDGESFPNRFGPNPKDTLEEATHDL